MLAVSVGLQVPAVCSAPPAPSTTKSVLAGGLLDELRRFAGPEPELVPAYLRLHTAKWPGSHSVTEQMLSMSDAMVGRYDQAQREMDDAFGAQAIAQARCPASLGKGTLEAWLAAHAGRLDLVMTHEAHNQPISRVLIYQMLPVMKKLGFSILALEALPDDGLTETINRQGYVLDQAAYGYYLREPIEAEIIRRAKRLGFTLARYDDFSPGNRESHQAANLLRLLKENPGKKVFVVAGYDHIRRADGRMAELLATKYQRPFLSIGQLGLDDGNDARRGLCLPMAAKKTAPGPSRLASVRWIQGGRGTDITAFRVGAFSLDRTAPAGAAWLSLGGERRGYSIAPGAACGHAGACLVEARYADEPADAVPADRYLLLATEKVAELYLKDGRYVLSYRDATGALKASEQVVVSGGELARLP